jgi:hypothetical protein
VINEWIKKKCGKENAYNFKFHPKKLSFSRHQQNPQVFRQKTPRISRCPMSPQPAFIAGQFWPISSPIIIQKFLIGMGEFDFSNSAK